MTKSLRTFLFVVLLVFTFTCTSCGKKSKEKQFDAFFSELKTATSVTATCEYKNEARKHQMIVNQQMTVLIDSKKGIFYTSGLGSADPYYLVKSKDGRWYIWHQEDSDDGTWTGSQTSYNDYSFDSVLEEIWGEIDVDDVVDCELLLRENFDYKKGKFYFKESLLTETNGLNEMVVSFTSKKTCVIEIVAYADTDYKLTGKITISKVNQTNIDLPQEIQKEMYNN